jgi:hypothetical protein
MPLKIGPRERFLRKHQELNRLRFRGDETPPQIAAEAYLKSLECELAAITEELNASWNWLDSKDFRKCSRHMDHAKQRLHRAIKKFIRKA